MALLQDLKDKLNRSKQVFSKLAANAKPPSNPVSKTIVGATEATANYVKNQVIKPTVKGFSAAADALPDIYKSLVTQYKTKGTQGQKEFNEAFKKGIGGTLEAGRGVFNMTPAGVASNIAVPAIAGTMKYSNPLKGVAEQTLLSDALGVKNPTYATALDLAAGLLEGNVVKSLERSVKTANFAKKVSNINPDRYINVSLSGDKHGMYVRNIPKFLRQASKGSQEYKEMAAFLKKYPEYWVAAIKADQGGFIKPSEFVGATDDLAKVSPVAPKSAEEITSLAAGEVPQQVSPVKKLQDALSEAVVKRREQEAIYSATRGERFVKGFKASQQGGEAGFGAAKSAMGGEMEKVTMQEALRNNLDQATIDDFFTTIRSKTNQGDYLNAGEGMSKLLNGEVPTESQLKLLSEIFPSDVVNKLVDNRGFLKRMIDGAGEVLNIPRALMSSFDMSAPFRQGVFLVGRPKQFFGAFKDMFKYAFSEKSYDSMLQEIKTRPTYSLMEANKLAITDMGKLSNREEAFMSNLAEKIPVIGSVIKGGNRAYSGFLNKLRADVFDDLVKKGESLGVDFKGKAGQDLAKFVNSATGRGDIGSLGDAAPLINGLLFSPRLMKSRLDLLNPVYYTKLEPFVRKEALKSLFTFLGLGTTVLGLAQLGGAEVESDPTSADFGKIKVGNTRYDTWGGFQQYVKLAAQLTKGELKSTTTGKKYKVGVGYKPVTRLDLLYRFIEQKEAPVPSFVTGLLKGQSATGEKFDVTDELTNRFVPMVMQDLKDLYEEGGVEALGKELPAFFGIGTQTYSNQTRKGAEPFGPKPAPQPKPKPMPKPKPSVK